jgi:hypothetical protein
MKNNKNRHVGTLHESSMLSDSYSVWNWCESLRDDCGDESEVVFQRITAISEEGTVSSDGKQRQRKVVFQRIAAISEQATPVSDRNRRKCTVTYLAGVLDVSVLSATGGLFGADRHGIQDC